MNKYIAIIILVIFVALVLFFTLSGKNNNLIAPGFIGQSKVASITLAPTPTSAPPVEPQTFKYDKSTDLKKELEKVNPQVLDSDFQ